MQCELPWQRMFVTWPMAASRSAAVCPVPPPASAAGAAAAPRSDAERAAASAAPLPSVPSATTATSVRAIGNPTGTDESGASCLVLPLLPVALLLLPMRAVLLPPLACWGSSSATGC